MTKSERKREPQAQRRPAPERSARPHPFGIRTRGFVGISSFGLPWSFVIYHLFLLLANGTSFAQDQFIDKAAQLELEGNFKQATILLNERLGIADLAQNERKSLEFERDRLDRIKKDFPYTTEALFAELQRSVKGLTRAEYDSWVSEGRFDSRQIDGQRFFMSSSVANLFFRDPELNSRRTPPKPTASLEKAYWQNCVAIKSASQDQNQTYVLPKRFHVTMTVTANAGAAPDGETLRVWLPVPRLYPFQRDFELTSSSSPIKHLDSEQSPIRSLYLEQPAKAKRPAEFKIEYNYSTWGVNFHIDAAKVQPCDLTDSSLKQFTREATHVVFTPEMRALSRQIAGDETNPYLKAKKFYDWIANQIKYSYAIEYSTIRNISDYCRTRGYGDCGQEALLFITLCRLNGIPARWQSGWNTFPGAKTIHDWSEIYLAPYGWMPVDPYMGIFAMRYATSLTEAQRRELRDFYFGGLDQYRMAANSDHSQSLNPPKQSMRSDNVDFQRGELETGRQNIYFDQYSWDLKWKEVPLSPQ